MSDEIVPMLNFIGAQLSRIADALEAGNEEHDEHSSPEYMERVLANQERALANTERELNIREAHNLWHKQQGPHEGTPTA